MFSIQSIFNYFFTITSPNRAEEIFDLIEDFAKSPTREIFGRYVWNRMDVSYYIGVESLITTQCLFTGEGLKTALFGVNRNLKKFDNQNENWTIFVQTVEENRLSGKTMAYCFSMLKAPIVFPEKPSRTFGGHHFMVIQYQNEKDEVTYRFFQSNVAGYTLEQYIMDGSLEIGHAEFLTFIQRLDQKEWTPEYTEFCSKYFGIHKPKNIGGKMDLPIKVEWDECSVERILKNKEEFEIQRRRSDFPKIIITSKETIKRLEGIEEQDGANAVLLGSHGMLQISLGNIDWNL